MKEWIASCTTRNKIISLSVLALRVTDFFVSMKEKEKRNFRFPIRIKATILIVGLALLLVETAMTYFAITFSNQNKESYKSTANNLANTVAEVIDVDKFISLKNKIKTIVDDSEKKPTSEEWGSDDWNDYIAQFSYIENEEDFIFLRNFLRKIESANSNIVDCLFLAYIDNSGDGMFIYIVDSAEGEDACPPGCIDPIYPVNRGVLEDPAIGFPAYITNTESYGQLVTAGYPVYDNNQEIVGYAFVDISLDNVRSVQRNSIISFFFFLLGMTAIVITIGLIVVHFVFSKPIKRLTSVAQTYNVDNVDKTHQNFVELKMNTHDEISDLAETIKNMENDVHDKINELTEINEILIESQKKTEEMTELANQDGLTGVKNKIAYNQVCKIIDEKIAGGESGAFGIVMIDLNYLKNTNDEYGHDVGDKALIKLVKVIKSVFAHTPIYRIGGDEFVIILRRGDYTQSSKLINLFNNRMKNINKGEAEEKNKISAAIGYAEFDPNTDKCVDDVFKKADKAMYDRKHQMKGDKK